MFVINYLIQNCHWHQKLKYKYTAHKFRFSRSRSTIHVLNQFAWLAEKFNGNKKVNSKIDHSIKQKSVDN